MSLVSIIVVLLIEQVHALPVQRVVLDPVSRLASLFEEKFNDGGRSHGAVAWGLGVALPAALVSLLHGVLMYFQPLLAFLLGIGILYLTMGFRQFSHFFTNIHLALRQGETDQARQLLAQWRRRAGDRLTSGDIARLAIEEALLSGIVTIALAAVVLTLPDPAPSLAPQVAEHIATTGLGNAVTAVLLAFRATDTLLEAVVLIYALLAVWALTPDNLCLLYTSPSPRD